MSIMSKELTGVELANALSERLSDLEFELLVRARIKCVIAKCHKQNKNLSESHDRVVFSFDGRDTSKWVVNIGETYSKCKTAEGEVLTATAHDAERMMNMYAKNKMSLLLAPPTPYAEKAATTTTDNDIPFYATTANSAAGHSASEVA